jgi:hypothetical protein
MSLEFEDITEAIIGSAFEVHNILGLWLSREGVSKSATS